MQLLPHSQRNCPHRGQRVMKPDSHTYFSGARTSQQQLIILLKPRAVFAARTCQRSQIFHIRRDCCAALCKHSRERWEANSSCLRLQSTCITVLVITTCSDFLTTHSPPDGSGWLQLCGKGLFLEASAGWDVVLALSYSPTGSEPWNDPAWHLGVTVAHLPLHSPGGIHFPICFQHLFNLTTSQPGWRGLSHNGP